MGECSAKVLGRLPRQETILVGKGEGGAEDAHATCCGRSGVELVRRNVMLGETSARNSSHHAATDGKTSTSHVAIGRRRHHHILPEDRTRPSERFRPRPKMGRIHCRSTLAMGWPPWLIVGARSRSHGVPHIVVERCVLCITCSSNALAAERPNSATLGHNGSWSTAKPVGTSAQTCWREVAQNKDVWASLETAFHHKIINMSPPSTCPTRKMDDRRHA